MRFILHFPHNYSIKIVASLVGVFLLLATLSGCGDALVSQMPQSISAGESHTCGLRENGEAVCWGLIKYAPDGRFTAISAGDGYTCGLRENGQLVCWGHDSSTQEDSGGQSVTAISVGPIHSCALISPSGEAMCSGANNEFGQTTPPDGSFVAISAGLHHSCGLRENGDAVCWGWNHEGQATDVAGENFVTISAGDNFTCGLRKDGTRMCWGGLFDMSLGGFFSKNLDGPYTAISAGAGLCVLKVDGTPECWWTEPPDGISLSAIDVGSSHICGVRKNGEAVCWGDNTYGKATPPAGRFAQPSAPLR